MHLSKMTPHKKHTVLIPMYSKVLYRELFFIQGFQIPLKNYKGHRLPNTKI